MQYKQWVSTVFDEAKRQGLEVESLDTSNEVLQVAAKLWTENKQTVKNANSTEAKRLAQKWVTVE